MKTPVINLIAIVFIAAIVAGCSSTPSRFYTLNSTASATGAPTVQYTVLVGPVSIPAEVDRPQFTVQAGPNRVAIDEFNRWAAPLKDNVGRVVAGDLAKLLGTPRVAVSPLANFNPDYRVTISIQRFVSEPGKAAEIDAVWTVRKSEGGMVRSGQTVANESVKGDNFDALAAAHSRALAKVSGDIAAAIRVEAGE